MVGIPTWLQPHTLRWSPVCERLGIHAAAVFLFVLPFGHVTAIRSLAFVLALTAVVLLWISAPPRSVPLVPVFLLWLAAACLSLYSSRDLDASIEAIGRDIVRSFLVFFSFYVLSRRLDALPVWYATSAIGFGFLSLLAVVSVYRHGEWRSFYVPLLGEYTTSALTVVPLLVGYFFHPLRQRRFMFAGALALLLILVAGYATLSRIFWAGVIIAAFAGTALVAWRRRRVDPRMAVGTALFSLMALGFAYVGVVEERGRSLTFFDDRAPILSAVTMKVANNPITGTGFGHQTDKAWYEAAFPGASIYHPHNVVLGYLDQMGVVGLFALVAIFLVPAVTFSRFLRGPVAAAIPAMCGLVLLVLVFVRNNFDFFFLQHNIWLFFAHLGIYLGEVHRVAATHEPGTTTAIPSG